MHYSTNQRCNSVIIFNFVAVRIFEINKYDLMVLFSSYIIPELTTINFDKHDIRKLK